MVNKFEGRFPMATDGLNGSKRRTSVSIDMLREVIDGRTYDEVAARFGVTRTAVERRAKAVALRLCREVGVDGLSLGGASFVSRLRERREAIHRALECFEPDSTPAPPKERILTAEEIARAVVRIRGRSQQPQRDVALFYMLMATGARPLEIVRLRVADYLDPSGEVRRESEMPAAASISGKARPLFFASRRLDEAMEAYLRHRLERRHGAGAAATYRGLAPDAPLFVAAGGEAFRITRYGAAGQRRYLCRPILEIYRKLFRYAELEGATPMSVRRTLAARLYDRGADEEQVGLVLGISDRGALRELFPRTRPAIATLVEELV